MANQAADANDTATSVVRALKNPPRWKNETIPRAAKNATTGYHQSLCKACARSREMYSSRPLAPQRDIVPERTSAEVRSNSYRKRCSAA